MTTTATRRRLLAGTVTLAVATVLSARTRAQTAPAPILIRGARIFDGRSPQLVTGAEVLVENGMISRIGANLQRPDGVRIIDAGGRTLIPGLLDSHVHTMVNASFDRVIYQHSWSYVGALAAAGAEAFLMRGFTCVRDVGGPSAGLKQAIDEGVLPGPRILPSGPFISQTSGHGDFDPSMNRLSWRFAGVPDRAAIYGWALIADGPAEVSAAVREAMRSGASQIKVMASGSVTGAHDPVDIAEYSVEELRAAVAAAEGWGTYVTVHAFSNRAVRNAVEAGVKSVEHAPFIDEDTIRLMKERGVWLSTQYHLTSLTPEQFGLAGTPAAARLLEVSAAAESMYRLAKQYGVRQAWGTDLFGSPAVQAQESLEFVARARHFSALEILKQATSENAELLRLSGLRHPYRAGPLGVIAQGAYGDMLVVDGNPLDDITILSRPQQSLAVIMKGGRIYKNTLG